MGKSNLYELDSHNFPHIVAWINELLMGETINVSSTRTGKYPEKKIEMGCTMAGDGAYLVSEGRVRMSAHLPVETSDHRADVFPIFYWREPEAQSEPYIIEVDLESGEVTFAHVDGKDSLLVKISIVD